MSSLLIGRIAIKLDDAHFMIGLELEGRVKIIINLRGEVPPQYATASVDQSLGQGHTS